MTDALAVVPMLFPPVAEVAWGFQHASEAYFFAMGYAASLMAGWTLLLIWAYARPIERRFVAILTLTAIAGLAATEVAVPGFEARSMSLVLWATTIGSVAGPLLSQTGDAVGQAIGLPPLVGPFVFSAVAFAISTLLVGTLLRIPKAGQLAVDVEADASGDAAGASATAKATTAAA